MSTLVSGVGVITRAIEPGLAAARLTAAPTLMNLAARERMFTKRNTTIEWTVDLGGAQVVSELVSVDSTTNATAQDTAASVSLRIAQSRIKHRFALSRILVAEAALLAPEELADLFQASVLRGVTAICREVNRLILNGTNVPADCGIEGLGNISTLASIATPYANLAKAVIPANGTGWNIIRLAAVDDTVPNRRPLSVNLLYSLQEALQIRESYFDMIVMHPSVATRYATLFLNVGGGFGLTPDEESNGLSKVELGLGGRYWNGIPIIEDPQCPITSIFTLNSSEVGVWSFAVDPGDDMANTALIDPSVTYGVNIHLAELPSMNSSVRSFELYCLPQFQIRNLSAIGAITNLNLS